MTAECIKKNGVNVKTAVQLFSKGNVETVYQSGDINLYQKKINSSDFELLC